MVPTHFLPPQSPFWGGNDHWKPLDESIFLGEGRWTTKEDFPGTFWTAKSESGAKP